jgi:hypothetical protein
MAQTRRVIMAIIGTLITVLPLTAGANDEQEIRDVIARHPDRTRAQVEITIRVSPGIGNSATNHQRLAEHNTKKPQWSTSP